MMKFNSLFPALVSMVTLSSTFLAGVLPATAVTLNYNVNGLFDDGATFSGKFSTDSVAKSLTDYSITTTFGVLPPSTYQFGAPGNSILSTATNFFELRKIPSLFQEGRLKLTFDGSIFDPPSSGVLNVVTAPPKTSQEFFSQLVNSPPVGLYSATRQVDSGIATTQPIPEPLSIIGTLIGGGAILRMRKKLTASTKVKVKQ
jgi:hypothetical protein